MLHSIGTDMKIRRKLHELSEGESFTATLVTTKYEDLEAAIYIVARSLRKVVRCKRGITSKGLDTITCLYLGKVSRSKYDMIGLLKAGDTKIFDLEPGCFASLKSKASTHARARGCGSKVEVIGKGKFLVTLVEIKDSAKPSGKQHNGPGRPRKDPYSLKYPFDTMKLGDTITLFASESEQMKIRSNAAARGRALGRKFSCNKFGHDAIQVTRKL